MKKVETYLLTVEEIIEAASANYASAAPHWLKVRIGEDGDPAGVVVSTQWRSGLRRIVETKVAEHWPGASFSYENLLQCHTDGSLCGGHVLVRVMNGEAE